MSKTSGPLMHAGAIEVIDEIDNFLAGGESVRTEHHVPHVITIPAFKSRSAKARLANALTKIPLRMVRKSTKDFYLYQKNLNHEMKHEIDTLKIQVKMLRKELNGRK